MTSGPSGKDTLLIGRRVVGTRWDAHNSSDARPVRSRGPWHDVETYGSRGIQDGWTPAAPSEVLDDEHLAVLTERTRSQRQSGQSLVTIAIVGCRLVCECGRRCRGEEVSTPVQFLGPVAIAEEAVVPNAVES